MSESRKKIARSFLLRVSLSLALLCSCHKKPVVNEEPQYTGPFTRGMPADYKKLSGYLSAIYSRTTSYGFDFYCAFADPCRHLIKSLDPVKGLNFDSAYNGTINAGSIFANSSLIASQKINRSFFYYDTQVYGSVPENLHWKVPGNRSLAKLDITVPEPFPVFIDFSTTNWKLKTSESFTIYPDSIFTNYDSLVVYVNDCMNTNYIIKGCRSAKTITFSPAEITLLQMYNSGCFLFTLVAYNHYHQIINNKLYLFESATKSIKWGNLVQ